MRNEISSIALDPIEKKPLYHFHPGKTILSVGFFGCNMRCPFCQNHEIAHPEPDSPRQGRIIAPDLLLELAKNYVPQGNLGVAFTYNEPLMSYTYVRDVSRLLKDAGLFSVVVTNGCFGDKVLDEILPLVDAFNIDLKGFRPEIYGHLGGNLERVMHFIERASKSSHVELTSLIVPGLNDSPEDMERQVAWISSLSPDIPLHISRFFPRYKMTDVPPTDIGLMNELSDIAKKYLNHVHLGNV